MVESRMINPFNRTSVAIWGLLSIGALITGNLWIYLEDGFSWIGIIAGSAIALFFFLMVGGSVEFFDRPKEVEMNDSGLVLHQRLGRKTIFAPWSTISGVDHIPILEPRKEGKIINSYLRIPVKKRYTITREIAAAIREQYKERIGSYPSNFMDTGKNSVRK